uniref:Uncharacterized protein n=1 Tax=Arundo donax TaxID=35708 RepID=A0A0A9DZX0_ARUDO
MLLSLDQSLRNLLQTCIISLVMHRIFFQSTFQNSLTYSLLTQPFILIHIAFP